MSTVEFGGVIGPTWRESTPWWPPQPTPPAGAPNVVLIVLDDVGYAQLGCYGSDIETPNLDALAGAGVRLANFHTTSLCSPTRACLLTGRNHHSNGMGRVADLAVGFPGYWGEIPKRNGFLSEVLTANGYLSQAVGKWHLTPDDKTHMGARRDSWPCARGFARWYGFHGGETHQFVPTLFQDNTSVVPPRRPEDGYHLTEDLADHAIRFLGDLRAVERTTPFFLYFATGACHSPHQAPRPWIDRYAGRFDGGWDAWREATFRRQQELGLLPKGTELSSRPPWVPAWDSLGEADRRVAARFMECFAGFLSHTDAQIGRLLAFLDELGEADDTIVIAVSDNGASAEGGVKGSINDARVWNGDPAGRRELRARIDEIGGPTTHNNYPWGWTMAGNTPFRRWKREVHEGGIADPCIVRWPAGLAARGEIRHQFAHAIDVMPTVLELVGIEPPVELDGRPQAPVHGVSFASVLHDGDVPAPHIVQHFEMFGSRGIYADGWKAVTFKPLGRMYSDDDDADAPFDDDVWELYHVAEDMSECHDLAAVHPDKLGELVDLWWHEARRFDVLPLDNRPAFAMLNRRGNYGSGDHYVFWPAGSLVPERVALNVRTRPHRIAADVTIPPGVVPSGVLLAMGTVLGGWSLHLLDGRLRYVHNYLGAQTVTMAGEEPVGPGDHELAYELSTAADLRGAGRLLVDGVVVATCDIPRLVPMNYSGTGAGLTCGWEQGPAVGDGYIAPFPFNAELHRVRVDAAGLPQRDPDAEFDAVMSEQ